MVTGLLLVLLLPIHIFLTHIGSLTVLSYSAVSARVSLLSIKLFYVVTVIALLVHGWTGFRGILFDLKPTRFQMKAIDIVILVIMVSTLAYATFIIVEVP